MKNNDFHPLDNDAINMVIGQTVSKLIALGKPLKKENIIALLRDSEQRSVDGMRKTYAEAIRKVTETGCRIGNV